MESDNSAKAGSRASRGKAEWKVPPDALGVKDWELRKEVREEGRRGVDGREGGLVRLADVERLTVGRRGREALAGVAMALVGLVVIEKGGTPADVALYGECEGILDGEFNRCCRWR